MSTSLVGFDPAFVESLQDRLEDFYAPDAKLHQQLLDNTKNIYDWEKSLELNTTKGLKNLLVKGFDDEQIWSQLQAHHQPLLEQIKKQVDEMNLEELNILEEQYRDVAINSDNDDDDNQDDDDDDNDSADGEIDERALRRAMTNDYEDDSEDEEEDEQIETVKKSRKTNNDDNHENEKPEAPEDIDDFMTHMEGKLDMIDDFEYDEEDKQEFNRDDAQALAELYGDDFDEEEESDDEDDEPQRPKTLFEEHQEKLLQEIEQLEEQNIADKEWQQTGETSGMKRPKNSLLEADLAFEHSSLTKPVITEEITKDLESIIINRIVTGIFDDPEKPESEDRKENLKNEAELKHEKSKKSLAQVYEEMYLKKVEGVDVEEEERAGDPIILKNKEKIKQQVATVLHTLNMMSSFNYVAPPVPSQKVVQNRKDAITLDVEAHASAATVGDSGDRREEQAPQEIISAVKWLPQGEVEMDKEDRKRKRRAIKEKSKKKFKSAEGLIDDIATSGGKKQRERLAKDLSESKGIDTDQRGFSSSKKFFNIIADNLQKHGTKQDRKKASAIEEDSATKKAYKMRM